MTYTTIISSQDLAKNLENPNWVVFDCRSSLSDHNAGQNAYLEGHIPNAQYCHLEDDFSSAITETSGRHPLPDMDQLTRKVGNWGVENNTQIIVYDDANGAYAVRMWWQLQALGHEKVAVLDGGINQWIKEKRQTSSELPVVSTKTFTANFDQQSTLTTEQIQQNLKDKTFTLLDARTPERFRGEAEPIDIMAGRIPNAVNRAFQLNLDENGLFLSAEELKQQFTPILAEANNDIVHMCGSGVTACHNILAMEIAGFTETRLYIGSWSEWISDDKRPRITG